MNLGARGRLFWVSAAIILIALLLGGILIETEIRNWYQTHAEEELATLAIAARAAVERAAGAEAIADADKLADRLAGEGDVRFTIVSASGEVLGDSTVAREELAALENHAHRPEIEAAAAAGRGIARRYSATRETEMLYLAMPFESASTKGFVRVSRPLDRLDRVVSRLRLYLVAGGLAALLLALLMSAFASHLLSRTLRRLVARARELAAGQRRSIAVESHDEFGGLADSLNRLSQDIESKLHELASERDRLASLLESMEEGVLDIDRDSMVTLINTAAAAMLGVAQNPAGRLLLEVARAPALSALVERGRREGQASAEFDLGSSRPRRILARASSLRYAGGMMLLLRDVTELRRLEKVRRDFVANASHELRTPVSVVLANAETLLDGALEDTAQARPFVEAIRHNAERLSRLIADLLDLSRIESGTLSLERRAIRCLDTGQRIVDLLRAAAQAKKQAPSCEIPADLSVSADERALEQILQNLLDNAIKYTPEDGRIRLGARLEDDFVRLEVEDDGPGIAPEHRERIFERFYRVDPGRSRELGGTGLGLAIVKRLAEAMGGSVGMEPVEPRGSRFWVRLPRAGAG
ncbi:MAG: HAMP domain-containing protein [Myxococcales bacterium]|nr:HAMP domain-containing protein [Myxococcales bacterium]